MFLPANGLINKTIYTHFKRTKGEVCPDLIDMTNETSDTNKSLTQISFNLPADLKIKEKARRILQVRFDHPDWSQTQIAKEVGVSHTRVHQILNHPRIRAVLPKISQQRMADALPDATKAYIDVIKQNVNLQVKEKAAGKLLSDKGVFDAPTVKVEGEITFKHVRELQEIVKKASGMEISDVVDGEIVADQTPPTVQDTTQA